MPRPSKPASYVRYRASGGAIADVITKLASTGTHLTLEAMRRETPGGLLDIAALPGMRPEGALKLNRELGIGPRRLEAAARTLICERYFGMRHDAPPNSVLPWQGSIATYAKDAWLAL